MTRRSAEDLMALARRGELPQGDHRQLELAVDASLENRLLWETGRAFDASSPVEPGDEALLARIVERAAASRSRSAVPRRRLAAAVMLAVAFATVGAAATMAKLNLFPAWLAPEAAHEEPSRSQPPAATKPQPAAHAPTAQSPQLSAPERLPDGDREAAPAVAPLDTQVSARRVNGAPAPSVSASPNECAVTFEAANRSRASGDTTGALRRYLELQRGCAKTREAQQSRITAGHLYLRTGNPAQALEQFRAYGAGALSSEARWGESLAQRHMGAVTAEASLLEGILRDYPGSPYALAAERRLRELRTPGATPVLP